MSRGLTLEQMEFLLSKGLSGEDMVALAKIGAAKSKGAERTARWRARRRGGDVTCDGHSDASHPPIDNNHTPHSPNGEYTPKREKASQPAKPEGVTDQTWKDFLAHRKAKRAPVTETVIAAIRREAETAGWSLEAALVETVSRGWQAFKAAWVENSKPQTGTDSGYLDRLIAKAGASP